MACFSPIRAFQGPDGVFFVERSSDVKPIWLSCGQCVGCRLERSRQWAVRVMHEASMWKHNCFVTLTYDPKSLAERCPDMSLVYKDFQDFMKRLRFKFSHLPNGEKWVIRFYMCGEYGSENKRPHFHACIFNFDFPDKYKWSAKNGVQLYRSPMLEKLWRWGFCSVGEVTFESAAYVARYIMDKVNGDMMVPHYVNEDGVLRVQEFTHMSLKPGIGSAWIDKYESDVYPHGMVVVRGKEARPPRYYDQRYKKRNPDGYEEMGWARERYGAERVADQTSERLAVRAQVVRARIRQLKREGV